MPDLANGGIVSGSGPIQWAEPDHRGCEYLIPLNSNTARNMAILAEAQRRLDTPEA